MASFITGIMNHIDLEPHISVPLEKTVQARLKCTRTGMENPFRDILGTGAAAVLWDILVEMGRLFGNPEGEGHVEFIADRGKSAA